MHWRLEDISRWSVVYYAEGDVFEFIPVDEDGNDLDDLTLTIDAAAASVFGSTVNEAFGDLFQARRLFRAAHARGVDLEVVSRRLFSVDVAKSVDEAFRLGEGVT